MPDLRSEDGHQAPYRIVSPFVTDSDELQRMSDYCRAVADGRALPPTLMPYTESLPSGSNLIRVERFIADFVAETGVDLSQRCGALAEAFLGEPMVLFKDKINFRHAGSPGFPAHQDSAAGWERYASVFVSVILTLVDSSAETGGFEFPRRAGLRELLPNLNGRLSDELFNQLEPEVLQIPAGSALVFDSYAPHRTCQNRSDRLVPHILLTFNRLAEGDQSEKYYADKEKSLKSRGAGYTFRLFNFGNGKLGEAR